MSGKRILTVVGTRPEAIKLFPLLHALGEDGRFESRVCVTGQHREMLDQVLALAEVRPDYDLSLMRPGQSLDELTAALLAGLGPVMDNERPDWVVVQGDTTTAMVGALCAYYRRIPVCHVEAGLRSGDIHRPWPEEVNRKVIGAIAALHCAPTEAAAATLTRENVNSATVHVTGNTVIDALHWITARIDREPALAAGLPAIGARFAGKRIIGVTSHRRENLGEGSDRKEWRREPPGSWAPIPIGSSPKPNNCSTTRQPALRWREHTIRSATAAARRESQTCLRKVIRRGPGRP